MNRAQPVPAVILATLILLCLTWADCVPSARAQDIQVTSADPPQAPQGTINLDVSIKGKGFKKGAVAKFFVTGTADPGGVTVNSTTFRGSTEVVANIDVADTATISKFDIQVQNADGRTGKGTELFAVVEKGTLSTGGAGSLVRANFLDAATDGLRSDGQSTQYAPCGFDYVDKEDPCAAATPAQQASKSQEATGGLYWLRTVPVCCAPAIDSADSEWEFYVANPSRWLVLDFSQPVSNNPCPGIDSLVAQHTSAIDWGGLGLPTPHPPPPDEDTTAGRCVDNVSVRFRGSQFLAGPGTVASLTLDIDEPQAVAVGTKRKPSWRIQWNAVCQLVFRGPLLVTTNAGVTTVQTTAGNGELADLFGESGCVGTYRMPFLLELRPAQ